MNRAQLLEKLAMELDEWPKPRSGISPPSPYREHALWHRDGAGRWVFCMRHRDGKIHKRHWVAARERLIKKAEEATGISTSLGASSTACDDQFAPDPYSAHGSIATSRDKSIHPLTGLRITEEPTAEEDEAFRACEQRIRDAELRDIFSKQARYQDANGEDWIDEFARTATIDEFRGAMRFTIGKYNRRAGKKDELIKEITKMEDYCRRWREYEQDLETEQGA